MVSYSRNGFDESICLGGMSDSPITNMAFIWGWDYWIACSLYSIEDMRAPSGVVFSVGALYNSHTSPVIHTVISISSFWSAARPARVQDSIVSGCSHQDVSFAISGSVTAEVS